MKIMSANEVHFFPWTTIKSQLVQRKNKLRIYKTLIWPVLSYGWNATAMTQSSQERLAIFGKKILRGISGSVYETVQDGD
jgi:hypothetical protein